jgi:hypothetical protein
MSEATQTEMLAGMQKWRKRFFYVLICISIGLFVFALLGGISFHGSLIPLSIIFGLFAVGQSISIYFYSSRRRKSKDLLDQELYWLFGSKWAENVGSEAYQIAQHRIQARRARRFQFLFVFLPIYLALVAFILWIAITFDKYAEPGANGLYWFAYFLTGGLLFTAIRVFPSEEMLADQEQAFGQKLFDRDTYESKSLSEVD